MAGRPKTMLKRVAVLETLAVELFQRMHETIPRQYCEEPATDEDSIWRDWRTAYGTVAKAVTVLGYLSWTLREKAGVGGVGGTGGPAWEFMEESRKLGEPTCEDIAREMGLFEG